jgi:dTDP-4-dehydrorhamnose 3,5-epimerase-like enzyme
MMKIIEGSSFLDNRGIISLLNDFDLKNIRRMYVIKPETGVIRAWQGHKKERKRLYVLTGCFQVQIVNMLDRNKRRNLIPNSNENRVFQIELGHYNGFEDLEDSSELLVFSDQTLDDSKGDDYRLTLEDFKW